MLSIKFNQIFYQTDKYGFLNLYFAGSKSNSILHFDGINIYLLKRDNFFSKKFLLLNYNENRLDLEITRITQSELDVTFIQISNGDILQIYKETSEDNNNQILIVLKKVSHQNLAPDNFSQYQNAFENANLAKELEIE